MPAGAKAARPKPRGPRLVAIGGHARSGTSMMVDLCNTHPHVRITHEFRMFQRLDVNLWNYARTTRARRLTSPPPLRKRDGGEPANAWQTRLMLARYYWWLLPGVRKVRLRHVRRATAHLWPEAQVTGDKLPRYHRQLDDLARRRGLLRVMIYRDCRDVVQSVLQRTTTDWAHRPFAPGRNPRNVARAWVRGMEHLERHREALHLIRYETLVTEPDGELSALGDYLGVDAALFDASVMRSTSVGKWRTAFTLDELDDIRDEAAETMRRWGYDPDER